MNKRPSKKLVLCTETLRNLDAEDLQNVAGGSLAASNCSTCIPTATFACSGCQPCA